MRCGRTGALLSVVAALTLAAVLLAPTYARAAEKFSFGPGAATFAHLHANHGYRVNFSETEGGYFFVRVKGHDSTTDFATQTGRTPGDHLVGDFGSRGRFDLRFVATAAEPVPTGSLCDGPKGRYETGYLVGHAHFRTERGFAEIRIRRVPAARESYGRLTCELSGPLPVPGHPKQKRTIFEASAAKYAKGAGLFAAPERKLTFDATQFFRHAKPATRRVDYFAELRENAGRVTVHRRLLVAASERSLRFPGLPSLPEELKVTPPAPFSGSAELLRTPESTYTWRGDLAAAFPGLDPIRLTGARFATKVCNPKGCALGAAEAGPSRGGS
jgi:hypothetical protein